MGKLVSAREAVGIIKDGQTQAISGCLAWIAADELLRALRERFDATQSPRGITAVFPVGTGDGGQIDGMNRLAKEGLLKRLIAGSLLSSPNPTTKQRPEIARLVNENLIEAYAWPMGAMMHWLREVARRSPGYLTQVGFDTYADPVHGGTRLTACSPELVRRVDFDGRAYLYYPSCRVDVGLIRATSSDEDGNLSFEEEPILSAAPAIALAAKAGGGKVIAQVKYMVSRKRRKTQTVRVPGALVDYVVHVPEQPMGSGFFHDESYLGGVPYHRTQLPVIPEGLDKLIMRRLALDVSPGVVTIFGMGISTGVPLVMAELGLFDNGRLSNYSFTTEHGPYGGIVMPGRNFSANQYADALLDGLEQFDAIDGGVCHTALLSFGEFGSDGCVNVSRLGQKTAGAGGFIDIAHNATKLVLAGSFTAQGLEVGQGAGGLRILKEGRTRKFLKDVQHRTYPALTAVRERGQSIKLVTERAVFDLKDIGLVLTEIAPGIDVQRDILAHMEFAPAAIAEPLRKMDSTVFSGLPTAKGAL